MNYPFKKIRAIITALPRTGGRVKAVWVRDPRSGRLIQTWRDADDSERSCTGRPRGPHSLPTTAGGRFKRAA